VLRVTVRTWAVKDASDLSKPSEKNDLKKLLTLCLLHNSIDCALCAFVGPVPWQMYPPADSDDWGGPVLAASR